jgi:hypothetical protein
MNTDITMKGKVLSFCHICFMLFYFEKGYAHFFKKSIEALYVSKHNWKQSFTLKKLKLKEH